MKRWTWIGPLAVFIGAYLLMTALRSTAGSDPVVESTPTTTTTTPLAQWEAESEIVVAPAVVVPTEVIFAGSSIEIPYDIVPMSVGFDSAVRPTRWTLLAGEVEFTAETLPETSRVVFDVGLDFDPRTISDLRLDRYLLRSPMRVEFRPEPDDFTAHVIAPGITAVLDLVQRQSSGTIVRVRLAADLPGATGELGAEGVGPGWVSASSNFGGGGLWTLSFEGDELPDPLPLVVRGIVWIPLESGVTTSLQGVPRG